MPRENQKRGRRAKHKQSEIVKEPAVVKIKARLPSPVLVGDATGTATAEEASPWPLLDPETRAYFEQIQSRILELEELGLGQAAAPGEDLDEEDDRVLLIRGALSSLQGHEIELATDANASFILERLLHSMDDFARRVLADRFSGQYAALAKDRFASHVLQSLFSLSAQTIDREARGVVAQRPQASGSEELPTMTSILTAAITELLPAIAEILYDPYASHLLRSSLILVTGQPFPSAEEGDKLRSKKSRKFKAGQAPLRSITTTEKGKERERMVPRELIEVKAEVLRALDEALGAGTDGASARQAATDGVACIVVQMMLNIEADAGKSDEPGSLLDRLLEGLISKLANDKTAKIERAGYIDTIMRDTTSSHILETILTRSSQPVLDKLWELYYVGRVAKLAGHPVANFTVARGIERIDAEALRGAVGELATEEEAVRRLLQGSRTGSIKAVVERSAALAVSEAEVVELLQDALAMGGAGRGRYLIMALLGLSSYDLLSKISKYLDFSSTPEISLQGSLLAQAWLDLPSPHSDPLLESLVTVPVTYLLTLATNPISSRVLDKALSASSVAGKYKRKLIQRFMGHYHVLADDRIGSHVAERAWESADPFLKEKIVKSLLDHVLPLQGARIGHFFARKVQLALYERRPAEWKVKIAAAASTTPAPPVLAPAAAAPQQVKDEEPVKEKKRKKRRAEEQDEVDDIFAAVDEGKKKRKSTS